MLATVNLSRTFWDKWTSTREYRGFYWQQRSAAQQQLCTLQSAHRGQRHNRQQQTDTTGHMTVPDDVTIMSIPESDLTINHTTNNSVCLKSYSG